MEKHDIWKTKEKCKRHGFQLVNTIEYQGEIYTGECPYCKEERDLNRFHARLASFHVYDTLDAIPLCYRKKTINGYLTDGYEDRVAAVNACLAIQDEKLSTVIMFGGKGNGKRHLLIATEREMLGQGKRVR